MVDRDKNGRFVKGGKNDVAIKFERGNKPIKPFKKGMKPPLHKQNCQCFRCVPGQIPETAFKKGHSKPSGMIGKKHSEETKRKMSIVKFGKKKTEETKKRMSVAQIGKKVSNETRRKLSKFFRGKPNYKIRGENNYIWKGGITPLAKIIHHSIEFRKWRKQIFERDNYTCQECFVRGNYLHPHHIKFFSIILGEFLQEYNQFSPIEDRDILLRLAFGYEPFWNINNGRTLCVECHRKMHKEEKISGKKAG